MIKDKITPELKRRMQEDIKSSKKSGNERGFLLCIDEKGGLYPSRGCEGDVCHVPLSSIKPGTVGSCVGEIQGNFHTHPVINRYNEIAKEELGSIPSIEVMRVMTLRALQRYQDKEKSNVKASVQMPSYQDILLALDNKCKNIQKGTVCTGTDLEENKVECWTARHIPEKDKDKICDKTGREITKYEIKKVIGAIHIPISGWVGNLFDREIIKLPSK